MASQHSDTAERRAYREAGHATMSYLIREGFIERFVPIDRSLILPAFEFVSIEGPSGNWGEITFGLGSLITVPQVLLSGYLAESMKFSSLSRDNDPVQQSPLARRAHGLITSYVEEYGGENMSFAERDRIADETFKEMLAYVDENLRTYWASVEALARALLHSKVLTERQAFDIVEKEISEQAKAKAQAFVNRDPDKARREIIRKMRKAHARSATSAPFGKTRSQTARKAWWEFWKK